MKKNFSWNLFGNIIYAATQWGLIIVITRLGNIEMVGMYSLALAITAPIMMFTNLELRTIQATDHRRETPFNIFSMIRIISNFIFLIILSFILYIGEYTFNQLWIIYLIACSKIVESWSDLVYGYFQKVEKMEYISKSQIIRGSSALLLVTLSLSISSSLSYSILFLTLAWFLTFLYYDIKNLKKFKIDIKPVFTREVASISKLALPLGFVALIVSLNSNIPRLFIEYYLSLELLGYFATIFYFVMIGEKLIRSVSQVILPRLSLYFRDRNYTHFKNLFMKLLMISLLIGIVGVGVSILIGEKLLILIYGEEFYGYGSLLILIMIYGMFNYLNSSLLVGLNALQYFKVQPYLSILWLITIIVSVLYFIQDYGIIGVGYSLIIYSIIRLLSISVVLGYGVKREFS